MGKAQSEVPYGNLPESASHSGAPQKVLGSLGHTEFRDLRFSVLETSDTAGYLSPGRAENKAGAASRLWPRAEGNRAEMRALWLGPVGRGVLGQLQWVGWFGGDCLGSLRGFLVGG